METSSTHIELKLPTDPLTTSNIPSPGLTGAVTPMQMGSDFKPFPSFDFMFTKNQPSRSDA